MIDCAIDAVTAILAAPVTGVAALLPIVPRRAGETLPTTVTVVSDLDNGESARDVAVQPPAGTVVLQVGESDQVAILTQQGHFPVPPDVRCELIVRITLAPTGTQPERRRIAALIVRAVLRSLRLAFEAQGPPLIVRSCKLLTWDSTQLFPTFTPPGTSEVGVALLLSLTLRDHFTNTGAV